MSKIIASDGITSDGVANNVLITVKRENIVDTSPITIDKTKFNVPFPCNHNMFPKQKPLSKSAIHAQEQKLLEAYIKHRQMALMYLT